MLSSLRRRSSSHCHGHVFLSGRLVTVCGNLDLLFVLGRLLRSPLLADCNNLNYRWRTLQQLLNLYPLDQQSENNTSHVSVKGRIVELEIAVLVLGEVIVRSIIKFDLQVAEVKFVLHNLAVEVFES